MEEESKYKKILDRYINDLKNEVNLAKRYERILILKNFIDWLKNGKYITLPSYRDYTSKVNEFSELFFNSKSFVKDLNQKNKDPFQNVKLLFFLSLVLVLGLITVVTFNFFLLKKVNDIALESESQEANRILPFRGTITEADGQALQSKRDLTFRLYDQPKGGKVIYTGSCVGQNGITPDHQGSFNIRIGADCQMKPYILELPSARVMNYCLDIKFLPQLMLEMRRSFRACQLAVRHPQYLTLTVVVNWSSMP